MQRQKKMMQELGPVRGGNSNNGQRTRGQTARMVKGQRIQSSKRDVSGKGSNWDGTSQRSTPFDTTSKGEPATFTQSKQMELRKKTLIHKK